LLALFSKPGFKAFSVVLTAFCLVLGLVGAAHDALKVVNLNEEHANPSVLILALAGEEEARFPPIPDSQACVPSTNEVEASCPEISSADPLAWGPGAWNLLHIMSVNYPIKANRVREMKCQDFMGSMAYMLPCGDCGRHFLDYVTTHRTEVKTACKSRLGLIALMTNMHNNVNKHLKKPRWKPEQSLAKYKKANVCVQDARHWRSKNPLEDVPDKIPVGLPANPKLGLVSISQFTLKKTEGQSIASGSFLASVSASTPAVATPTNVHMSSPAATPIAISAATPATKPVATPAATAGDNSNTGLVSLSDFMLKKTEASTPAAKPTPVANPKTGLVSLSDFMLTKIEAATPAASSLGIPAAIPVASTAPSKP